MDFDAFFDKASETFRIFRNFLNNPCYLVLLVWIWMALLASWASFLVDPAFSYFLV